MDGYLQELGGSKNGFFKRNQYIVKDEKYEKKVKEFLKEYKNTDVYRTVFTYESDDIENCLIYGPLYFDLDHEIESPEDFKYTVRDALMLISYLKNNFGIPEEMLQIYFSGSKGFHILIDPVILGITPSKDLDQQFKVIAKKANEHTLYKTIDMRIYERKRLFRFVNSVNSKSGLYKVPIKAEDLRGMTLEKIQEYASEPKEVEFETPRYIKKAQQEYNNILIANERQKAKKKNKSYKSILPDSKKELLPCVDLALEQGVGEGRRNNTSVALASSLFQSGYTQQEAIELLLAWNEKNEPALPEGEIYSTVNSAYKLALSGRGFGCAFFKENDMCIGESCKLFNR